MNRELTRDNNGFVQGLLMNPWVVLILVIGMIIAVVTGALFVLFAPLTSAALLIVAVGVLLIVKGPFPDPKLRLGIPIVMFILAGIIYLYGDQILAVVV